MNIDFITIFKRAEFYKKKLNHKTGVIIAFTVLSFLLGIAVARAYYLSK